MRDLLFVAIGGFALVARYVAGVLSKEDWVPRSRLYRVPAWIVCIALLLIHVPVALGGRLWSHRMFSRAEQVINSTVAIGEPSDMPNRHVVVINAPNPFLFIGLPQVRSYAGKALPKTARVLVPGWRPLEITRTGGRTLVVRSKAGNLLSVDESRRDMRPSFLYLWRTFNTLFRSVREPFCVGQQVECPEVSVQVLAVDVDGVPTAVQCEFARDLKGPSWYWLQWNWKERGLGSYSEFVVPPIGQSVTLAGPL